MNPTLKSTFKRMGVINITPNSFSDANQFTNLTAFENRLLTFGPIEALDVGAESTAPMNEAISWRQEWERFEFILPLLETYEGTLSIDTYHPETMFEFVKRKKDKKLKANLIWNDVSGKFDEAVREFLETDTDFKYVYCHNLAPSREKTIEHMKRISSLEGDEFLKELSEFFAPYRMPQVILDPCLGFSKSYEQNWLIINEFEKLQRLTNHHQWLLGFSRKSFLRKKYQIEYLNDSTRDELDHLHQLELKNLKFHSETIVWIRTHRPEFLT